MTTVDVCAVHSFADTLNVSAKVSPFHGNYKTTEIDVSVVSHT